VSATFAFEDFLLDASERRLKAGTATIELNGRYFDALALLVREPGRLVTKDRFMDEVWRGVPVTDEALTQCIRTLRRQLGDEAARPRFIETIPKHGYRFIAPVTVIDRKAAPQTAEPANAWRDFVAHGAAGTLGGGLAGVIGGLIYGFAAAAQPGVGATSILLVLLCVTTLVALIGAAGVSFGIASASFAQGSSWQWMIVGGAGGGLVVGAVTKLIGLDAFTILIGHSPGNITGAMEGMFLGGAVGLGTSVALRSASLRRGAALAGVIGAAAGVTVTALGGRLMLGSLALLVHDFPDSRLRLDQIGRLFGEAGVGPMTQFVSTALEAGLFASCIAGAMVLVRRTSARRPG
jgi:DNA-binding winged helix-turn-helix (wHTH) protein